MLILTRKIGKSIKIGNDVTVTVLDVVKGEDVKIGIDAPDHVIVDRSEVRERRDKGWQLDEGSMCPQCNKAKLSYQKDGDCSCHNNPPCGACTNSFLACDNCGFEPQITD
jgi:carbon storage regulator